MSINFNYSFNQYGYNVQLTLVASGGPVAPNQYLITNALGSVNGSQVVQLYAINQITNLSAVGNNNIVDATAASTGYIVGTNSVGFRTADGNNYVLNYFAGFNFSGMFFFPPALRLQINSNSFFEVSNGTYSYQNVLSVPTTEIIAASLSADTGSDNSDFITKSELQTISGTLSANLAAGESVHVSLDDGSTWVTATATVGQNTWSLAGQVLTGPNTLKVRVEDASGNAGTTSSYVYSLDQAAPSASVSTASVDIGSDITTAQSTELGLVYLVDAAATVTDLDSLSALVTGGLASQANITSVGTNTSITTTGLSAGFYKVYAVDAAGNVSAASVNGITLTSPVAGISGIEPSPVFDIQVVAGRASVMLNGDRFSRGAYDHITGSVGNDTLWGYLGNDTLWGGSGFDVIRGGRGNDSLQGGLNADTLFGGRGNDILEGGRGHDVLYGGVGRDALSGGAGNDVLTGGDGADVFIFMSKVDGLSNIDLIADFVSGVDRIELSASVFSALVGMVGQAIGLSQHISYNAATGELFYAEDNSGAGSPKAFAVLGTGSHPASIGNDFWVVA